MGNLWLPGESDFALALREPNLLVPGTKPFGQVRPKRSHPFTNGLGCLFCDFSQGDLSQYRSLINLRSAEISQSDLLTVGYENGALIGPGDNLWPIVTGASGGFEYTTVIRFKQTEYITHGAYAGLIGYGLSSNYWLAYTRYRNTNNWQLLLQVGSGSYTSAENLFPTGQWNTLVIRSDTSGAYTAHLNGAQLTSGTNTQPLYNRSGSYALGVLGGNFDVPNSSARCALAGFSQTDIGAEEARRVSIDPFSLIESANQSQVLISVTAGGGVTGDLAAQEAGSDTAAVTGTVIVKGDLSAQESGTDTASLNGSVLVAGDLSVQEVGADTAAFDGSATTDITGDLVVQETGPDTAALTGSITVQGDLSAQETGPDTATIIGAGPVAITGDLAAQESGSDTAAMAGLVLVAGTLSVQEIGADGAVINGTVHVSGTLAAQETGADDATFIGTGPVPVTGNLVVQEVGSDHLVIAGYIGVAGTLSVQETGPDGAVITGSVLVTGAMLATETGADTAAGTGSVIITGDLAVQEIGADTAFLSFEEPGLTGNLIVQESTADKASFLALFPTCHAWSNYDLAQAKLNAALIDVFGESVMFDPTGYQYPVTALFEVTGPENSGSRSRDVQDIGNTESYRPRPYLMMRTSDVADLDIKARQTVIVRGKNMTVVSDPFNDGQCMTMVYVRGDF